MDKDKLPNFNHSPSFEINSVNSNPCISPWFGFFAECNYLNVTCNHHPCVDKVYE